MFEVCWKFLLSWETLPWTKIIYDNKQFKKLNNDGIICEKGSEMGGRLIEFDGKY